MFLEKFSQKIFSRILTLQNIGLKNTEIDSGIVSVFHHKYAFNQ